MWNKPIKVFKGVENRFDITVQDFDQQPVAVRPYILRFRAVDDNGVPVLSKVVGFRPGKANTLGLDIMRDELTDLNPGLYSWGISIDDGEGTETPLYLDLNGGSDGSMEVGDWSYADDALASAVLDVWAVDTSIPGNTTQLITNIVDLSVLEQSELSPLHTVAVFSQPGTDGTVYIESSTFNVVNTWAQVNHFLIVNGVTNTYANFYGLYDKIRFRFIPSTYNTGRPLTLYYRLF